MTPKLQSSSPGFSGARLKHVASGTDHAENPAPFPSLRNDQTAWEFLSLA